MFLVRHWFQKVATVYRSDLRRQVRLPANFDAMLNGWFGTLYATAVDVNRNGLGVRSASPLHVNTSVFLRIPELALMGYAKVRHCSERAGAYHIGLKFCAPLAHDFEADGVECGQLRREACLD